MACFRNFQAPMFLNPSTTFQCWYKVILDIKMELICTAGQINA